jgi:hypothetical protein
MRNHRCCLALLTPLWAFAQPYYVAPQGDDLGPGSLAQPFRTIDRARAAARAALPRAQGDVVVFLRGGVYSLERPLVFDAADSGVAERQIVYRAYPGEQPVLSGGVPITGWTQEGRWWRAPAPLREFRQLWVNGRLARRARGPAPPGMELLPPNTYRVPGAALAQWKNPDALELIYDIQWQRNILKVHAAERAGAATLLRMAEPWFTLARLKEGKQIDLPTFLENALELLDQPGEWYHDAAARTLYYLPRDGEAMPAAEVIAPRLERLLEIRGTLDAPVRHLRFEGIAFAHAGWTEPSRIGHVDLQANFRVMPQNLIARSGHGGAETGGEPALFSPLFGEARKSPANVVLHAAAHIRFERCRFVHLGGAGIDLEYGSAHNVISGSVFRDIAGTAIQIGDVTDHHPADPRAVVRNNSVVNCLIEDAANYYLAGVGIFAGYTAGTRLAHNEIRDLPYSGISVGWGWGETDEGGGAYWLPFRYAAPTPARDNLIEYNHIHRVCRTLWDGAGIYTLGNQPGTVIRGNYVHDNPGWPGGIYLDEGSGYIEVTGNLVHGVQPRDGRHPARPINYNNRAQNRLATCKEHGNWFGVEPGDAKFPRQVAEHAGLQEAYRDLLQQTYATDARDLR